MAQLKQCIAMMDEGIERVGKVLPQMPALEARLSRLMLMLGLNIEEDLEAALKPNKLNHSEFLTLMILYSRPDGASTPGELCEYTAQGATNMTRIGNTLVKRGLVIRSASESDRRRVVMRITAAGRRLAQKVLPPIFPRLASLFTGFSTADKRQLDRLLRKLAGNLDLLNESRNS
ncbi:MarR family transcriptional regulator [Rhodanobacter sp. AS-Z3]|uniref:MarR family winged helix-turn-helix transcriptional regulator n=1 Tax=Rhodanobacter sp. AS-Z3 TaxID=3031330 RepID=UPI00247834BF|nr:MarR family transcriptional regulator [Rhodanobacter sp. AS-Z3]WEN14078.1 MarR family transcriptional regulator [Rhodanobacter sp. AS-Z3]